MDKAALKQSMSGPVLRRSLVVSLIVGTLLSAINHGDEILAGVTPNLIKVALTYIVPLLVTTYGAYSAFAAQKD